MQDRVPRLMSVYRRGREAILIGLYQAMVCALHEDIGSQYTVEQIKVAVATVINRLTMRPEARPDPRDADDVLGAKTRELTERQLVKEAAALVLLLDVGLGELGPEGQTLDPQRRWTVDEFELGAERLEQAERLAGPDCESVRRAIDPRSADPDRVEQMTMTMAGVLVSEFEYEVRKDLFGDSGN